MYGGGGVVCSLLRACGIRISKVKIKNKRFFIKECYCFEKGWAVSKALRVQNKNPSNV